MPSVDAECGNKAAKSFLCSGKHLHNHGIRPQERHTCILVQAKLHEDDRRGDLEGVRIGGLTLEAEGWELHVARATKRGRC